MKKAMAPSEIRARVLDQHGTIEVGLAAVEATLRDLKGLDLKGREAHLLRAEVALLCGMLRMHLDFEEAVLTPALAKIDAWGLERAERVMNEHRQQRETAADLEHLIDTASLAVIKPALSDFIAQLRAEMREEERVVLTQKLFSDLPSPADALSS